MQEEKFKEIVPSVFVESKTSYSLFLYVKIYCTIFVLLFCKKPAR
jgi:hypothetical protein